MMKENAECLFEKFLKSSTCKETLQTFHSLCKELNLEYPPPRNAAYDHVTFYARLKKFLGTYWKAQSLFAKLDKKYNDDANFTSRKTSRERDRAAKDFNVLIIGAGPCGLRTAIFTSLLGAKTVVVEKRDSFSRNNVLHLWPFTIEDLKALGAKKFNGRFCSGAIDHVSIRQLQLILIKSALIFGVEIHVNTGFCDLIEPNIEGAGGWSAKIDPESSPVSNFKFHMIVGADGRKNTLKGFEKKEFRGSLAIGITVNFINKHTRAEAQVSEISGINFIYRQDWFRELNRKHNIDLENIVYYKDDTHYFVMTARKVSLVERGVFINSLDDPRELVHDRNIDKTALLEYALDAVNFSTENKLPNLEVAINNYGLPDIALFDFTCMKSSVNAAMFREVNGVKLLAGLVGDGLIEPFWPKGTGIAKGFLAAFDTCWMLKQWVTQQKVEDNSTELSLLSEREALYRILPQVESNSLVQNYSGYSIDPKTRYIRIPSKVSVAKIRQYYVTDGKMVDSCETDSSDANLMIVPPRLTRNVSFVKSNKLQHWCEKVLFDSGADVKVLNMSSSWKDGRALCTIINYYRPDALDLDALEPDNAEYNNQLAFDAAEKYLGITPIMSGKEMAECQTVDDLLMVTYISQFYEILKNEVPVKPVKRVSDIIATPPDEVLPKTKKKSPLGLLVRISQQFKRKSGHRSSSQGYEVDQKDSKRRKSEVAHSGSEVTLTKATLPTIIDEDKENDVVVTRPKSGNASVRKNTSNRISAIGLQLISQWEQNSDIPAVKKPIPHRSMSNSNVCYFCGKTVYIVERLSVEGLFFHRECFKCSHCETPLRSMNYKRDLDSGKFYCSVHYFANAEYSKQGTDSTQVNKAKSPTTSEISFKGASEDKKPTELLTPEELNLSVPTIENGKVVLRRDLTPSRADMEKISLSIFDPHVEVEEDFLYKHNMRCSHNSDSDSIGYTSESEAEELDAIADEVLGLRNHSAQEILSGYHNRDDPDVNKLNETTLLSSESEGDEDLSSLSSTTEDGTMAVVDETAKMTEVKDDVSLSTVSSDNESQDDDDIIISDVEIDTKDKEKSDQNILIKISGLPNNADLDLEGKETKQQEEQHSTDLVSKSMDPEKKHIDDKNPVNDGSKSNFLLSSSSESEEQEYETQPGVQDKVARELSTESSEESDVEADLGTDFRSPAASPAQTKNDTSVWVSNLETGEDAGLSFTDAISPIPSESISCQENDGTQVEIPKIAEVVDSHTETAVASTPKVSRTTSDSDMFFTPCADRSEIESFHTVKSNQTDPNISFELESDATFDTTVTSDTVDSAVATDSPTSGTSAKSGTGRKLPETPKIVKGMSKRRRLPIIPHLEALSPTGDISPKQQHRIASKLKKHEDRVMERIRKMKLGVGPDSTENETKNTKETPTYEEEDDFVNHLPLLLQRRNKALLKKKHKRDSVDDDKKTTFSFGLNKKKAHKEKQSTPPQKARIMSPTTRSSRRRLPTYTKEEIDNRVSYRVRVAAQRQAKEAERKRMARALVIQGQLQEVDTKQKQLEERGVKLEKLLRDEKGDVSRQRHSSIHMHEWFKLVQEKNALLRYENELMIYQEELQLEDKQSRLQQELRERMAVNDSKKTAEELAKEKEILSQMMKVVEERDQLVAVLDEHRVQDSEENFGIEQVLTQKFLKSSLDPGTPPISSL